MSRNWAAFVSVSAVTIILAAIGVVGATQGLLGVSGNDEDAPQVVNLRRTSDGRIEAFDGASLTQISAPSAADSDSSFSGDSTSGVRSSSSSSASGTTANAANASSASSSVGSGTTASASASSRAPNADSDDDDGEEKISHTSAVLDAVPGETTYQVGEAGFVTLALEDGRLRIVFVDPLADWSAKESESSGATAKVEFRSGDQEVEFKAEVVGDEIRVGVSVEFEDEHDDDHESERDDDEHDDDD